MCNGGTVFSVSSGGKRQRIMFVLFNNKGMSCWFLSGVTMRREEKAIVHNSIYSLQPTEGLLAVAEVSGTKQHWSSFLLCTASEKGCPLFPC